MIYLAIFILALLIGGYFYIEYLTSSVEEVENRITKALKEQKIIKERALKEQKELKDKNDKLTFSIAQKQSSFEALEDKIGDLEEKMGLNGTAEIFSSDLNITNLDKNVINNLLRLLPSGNPVKNCYITSPFGYRMHPILKKKKFHTGLDFAAKGKKRAVRSKSDGVVYFASKNGSYGYMVKIVHAYGFKTYYAHLKKKLLVKKGDFVTKGDILGYIGNTGRSTAPHLHYEIRFLDKPLNPHNFINWSGKNFYKIFNKEKRVPWQSLVKVITTTSVTNQSKHQKQQ